MVEYLKQQQPGCRRQWTLANRASAEALLKEGGVLCSSHRLPPRWRVLSFAFRQQGMAGPALARVP
jgi:hypothetical protein